MKNKYLRIRFLVGMILPITLVAGFVPARKAIVRARYVKKAEATQALWDSKSYEALPQDSAARLDLAERFVAKGLGESELSPKQRESLAAHVAGFWSAYSTNNVDEFIEFRFPEPPGEEDVMEPFKRDLFRAHLEESGAEEAASAVSGDGIVSFTRRYYTEYAAAPEADDDKADYCISCLKGVSVEDSYIRINHFTNYVGSIAGELMWQEHDLTGSRYPTMYIPSESPEILMADRGSVTTAYIRAFVATDMRAGHHSLYLHSYWSPTYETWIPLELRAGYTGVPNLYLF